MKNKATNSVKIYEVLKKIGLDSKVGNFLRGRPFLSDNGVAKLYTSKGTHWFCNINENYFDCYDAVCPKKLSKFVIKRNRHCLYSEYQIQINDSFCASYCLFILYLTKVLGLDFKSAALNLYCQMIK